MCTAATYQTKDFYFGRTLDYEFSYGDQIVVTPRNYHFQFRHTAYPVSVWLMWRAIILCTMTVLMKKVLGWQDLIL